MGRFIPPEPLFHHAVRLGMSYPSEVGSLINGEPVRGEGAVWKLIYPATEEEISTVHGTTSAEVDKAAAIAHACFRDGSWSRKRLEERQRVFYRIAELIDEHADELAFLQTCETGIPFAQFRGMHVSRAAQNFRFFSDVATSLAGETYTQTGNYLSITLQEPIGVGGVISPWNAPLALATMKVAACMITGNSCIIKPSEQTPYSLLRLVELMIRAGVPKGAVHLLNGTGPETGNAMVANPQIGAINFVGGTQTGKRIMAGAADTLKKLSLELGGKSANIITETADLEASIDGALLGIFAGNGEQCLAGSRILVQRAVASAFIRAFASRARNLVIGDPFCPEVEIGPLAFKAHYERVLRFAGAAAVGEGKLLCGGDHPSEDGRGYFLTPVVVEAASNEDRICQEEIFGPFASILVFDEIEDAIRIANDSEFGLVSYVWTSDIQTMMSVAHGVEAGTVWVNTPMTRDLRAPFGGYKMSGFGRDGLPGSIELFTEQKTVMIPKGPLTIPRLGTSQ